MSNNHEQEQFIEEDDSWSTHTKKQHGGRKQKGIITSPTNSNNTTSSVFGSSMNKKKSTSTSHSNTGTKKNYSTNKNTKSSSTGNQVHIPNYKIERTIDIPQKVDPRFLVGEKGHFSNEVKTKSQILWYSVKNGKVILGGNTEESIKAAEEMVNKRITAFSMNHFSETFSALVSLEFENVGENKTVDEEFDICLTEPINMNSLINKEELKDYKRMTLVKKENVEEFLDNLNSNKQEEENVEEEEDKTQHVPHEHVTHHKEMIVMNNSNVKSELLDKISSKLVDIELRKEKLEVLSVKAMYGQFLLQSNEQVYNLNDLINIKYGKDVKYLFNRNVDLSFYNKLNEKLTYIPEEDSKIITFYFTRTHQENDQTTSERTETFTFEVNKEGKLDQIKKNEHTRNYFTLNYVTPTTYDEVLNHKLSKNDFKITIASYVPIVDQQQQVAGDKVEMENYLNQCITYWNDAESTFKFNNEFDVHSPPAPYKFKGIIIKKKKHYHSTVDDKSSSLMKITLFEMNDFETNQKSYEVVVISEELYKHLDENNQEGNTKLGNVEKKRIYKECLERLTNWLFEWQ
ncbi:hypothetical protein ABK040_011129 [Willaertia magna]